MSIDPFVNPARVALEHGGLSLGIGLRQARTADIGRIMRTCGYNWLFVDLKHNAMSIDTAVQISIAALDAGIAPLVRVPAGEYALATRALDGGAMGIVMPHVDTADEAAELVARLRYPPQGHRSMAGAPPQFGFRSVPVGDAAAALNAATLLVPMLETPLAVANADAIAAVDGVDVLLIGTNDLAMEYGVPGRFDAADIDAAYRDVIAACRRHGKVPGMGGVNDERLMQRRIADGMRFILSGSDLGLLMQAATARSGALRKMLSEGEAP